MISRNSFKIVRVKICKFHPVVPLFLDLMQKCEYADTVAMTFVAGLMKKMTIRRV